MNLRWIFMAAITIAASPLLAQVKKTAPSKPAATKSKSKKNITKKKTSDGEREFAELICYEDGPCTFDIQKGDTLVYELSSAGNLSRLFIVPNKYIESTVADFNWFTDGTDLRSGHVVIYANALKSSKHYVSYLPSGELKLNDASFLWLCADNFTEITKTKSSPVTFDGNVTENFSSPAADAASAMINYKGKTIELDGFIIQNKPEGEPDRKEMWVMNITSNLLIIKQDLGKATLLLKEVRERKTPVSSKSVTKPAPKKA